MSALQKADLEKIYSDSVQVTQINRTITSAYELKDEIAESDIVAVVMPLNLQEQVLKIAGSKPVLIGRNHRVQKPDGTFEFVHAGWDRVFEIKIIKTELSSHVAPENKFR